MLISMLFANKGTVHVAAPLLLAQQPTSAPRSDATQEGDSMKVDDTESRCVKPEDFSIYVNFH